MSNRETGSSRFITTELPGSMIGRSKNNPSISNRDAELNNNVGVSSNAGTDNATGSRAGTDNSAMDEELQTIQRETEEALRGVLTPDQFKRYLANRSKYEQIN